MNYITLPCFFENDRTKSLKLLSKDSLLTDYTIRDIIFFKIDALEPAFEKETNTNYTIIHLGSTDFATPLTVQDTLNKIQKAFSITNVEINTN
jgi:hypothetical protein